LACRKEGFAWPSRKLRVAEAGGARCCVCVDGADMEQQLATLDERIARQEQLISEFDLAGQSTELAIDGWKAFARRAPCWLKR
jgi:hypothetical protein